MIRLIASDIDGTLIPYGQTGLPQELFPLIDALCEKEVLFCPASGRQYHSLRRLFAPVADRVYFLCENGAAIFGPSVEEDAAPLLSKSVFPRAEAMALCRDIMACPGGDVFISGENTTYVCRCDEALVRHTVDFLGNRCRRVKDPDDIPEDIIKISAYCIDGVAHPMRLLAPRWEKVFHVAEAGPRWIDFTLSDKGTGVAELCGKLGIAPADVAAFGDNWNDLAMLELVGHPFLMSTADPVLRERIPSQCDSVVETLRRILAHL